MILYCCKKCANMAKKSNPSFEVGALVVFIGDIVECDICGGIGDLYRCEDMEG